MALDIPIEERYNCTSKRVRQMHHVWAATAAAVVTVAAGATSAAMSMSAADKARKSQAAAAKKAERKEKKASKQQQQAVAGLEAELAGIQAPQWDIGADIADAERVTGYNQAQLEKLYPGARNQTELASRAITDYMRGVGPAGATEQTLRNVAEFGGAGFNIATAGKSALPGVVQTTQANLARHLGRQADEFVRFGLNASRDWQALASGFIESVLQVGQSRLGFEKAASDLAMAKAEARFGAKAGLADFQYKMAQGQYGRDIDTVATRFAQQQATAKGVKDIGSAVAGGLTGYGNAINAKNTAQWGGGTYGSVGEVQQAAPYASGATRVGAGMYVPRAQAVDPAIEAKYSVYR